jgi:nuclear polyadenylated RNA-binding protein NAB2
MPELALGTPLAEALSLAIQPKLVEIGWSSGGGDDESLAEYIILMLINGKTQDQIAAELSGDLLNLGPDDPGAIDFSRWLFAQVELLSRQFAPAAGQEEQAQAVSEQTAQQTQLDGENAFGQANEALSGGLDTEMDGDSPDTATESGTMFVYHIGNHTMGQRVFEKLTRNCSPTGPKSMRGDANKRMLGQISKQMDGSRSSVLNRTRGSDRVGKRGRDPPRGPRGGQNNFGAGPLPHNPRPLDPSKRSNGAPAMGGAAAGIQAMSAQQQMAMLQFYEEQARAMAQGMAQILSPQQQMMMMNNGGMPMGNPGFGNGFQPQQSQPQSGKSLFERTQRPQHNARGGFEQNQRGGFHQNQRGGPHQRGGHHKNGAHHQKTKEELDAEMDLGMTNGQATDTDGMAVDALASGEDSICKFNLRCTNADCKFGHQSPAAPPGVNVDLTDTCPYGAACKNHKCTGRHPSPAQRMAYKAEQECKFFPNCTNPKCPFQHPTTPLCRFGADCSRADCKFTHVKTKCKFNPCLNPLCAFKHEEGQKKGKFEDKVWENKSERKFVDESAGEEILIGPSAPSEAKEAEQGVEIDMAA